MCIQPKLLLLYRAAMAEMPREVLGFWCWNSHLFGFLLLVNESPISRGHNFGGGSHCGPSGNFRFEGKRMNNN